MLDRQAFRTMRQDIARMYGDGGREAARLRGNHLGQVLRLTPQLMLTNLLCALVVALTFDDQPPAGLTVWLLALLTVCGLALRDWHARRGRVVDTASPRALHHATLHAAVLGGLWAVVPALWFADTGEAQRMTVSTLITGMLGAGSFVLSPLPWASLVWATLLWLGAGVALWRVGDPALTGVAVLLSLYSPVVIIGSLMAWRQATQLIRAQAAAAHQEQVLAVLLHDFEQQAGEALWETGADGRLNHASPRLAELLHASADALPSLPFVECVEQHGAEAGAALRAALQAGVPFKDLRLSLTFDALSVHLSIRGKPVQGEAGQPAGWRGVLADITSKVNDDRLLWQLAHTDTLTGLANRFSLRGTLLQALQRGQPVGLVLIDLDHFKSINDSHGHSVGDEVLQAVASSLVGLVRAGDLVARLGGDEFAVLHLGSGSADESAALAGRLVAGLAAPLDIGGRRLRVGASAGVAFSAGAGPGVDQLLVQADVALYAAKAGGRGRHALYADELGEQSHRRSTIEQGLGEAIERGELELHWQPKVEIGSWTIVGAEALLRWAHPTLGRVGPAEFIAVAEQGGLIDALGQWALREACRAGAQELKGLTVSVNVSPLQLREGVFVAQVRDALREFHLEPARLELEITESIFIEDAEGALAQLRALRSLGVRVALDDFGTGYSSLSYLRRFPFDTLKIDRAFVHELLQKDDARAIVQMIATLAGTLGMRTVCEGVETADQLAAVDQAGCDEMQGYLVSAPRPLAAFAQLVRDWPGETTGVAPDPSTHAALTA